MKIQRTWTVIGLSAILAVSAVSVAFAQPGGATLDQRGGGGGRGGQMGHMGGMRMPGAFIGIRFEPVEGGVKVTQVLEGSPAEAAGLLVDDVITAIGGTNIGDGAIRETLRDYEPGDALDLTVTRGTETLTVSVILSETPIRDAMRERGQARLGAVLEEDTLTVAEVIEGSPAETAGLLVGDTITAINGTAVTTRQDVMTVLMAAHVAVEGEETAVTVTVTRDSASVDLSANLPARPEGMPRMGRGGMMGRGMHGMFLQPREDGSGFDVVIPFTLAEGIELTAEAQASMAELGWTVQPKEGEEGVYELIIPAESVRDGMNLNEMPALEGMEGMMFDGLAFSLPDGANAMHFEFNLPDGSAIPAAPAGAGGEL